MASCASATGLFAPPLPYRSFSTWAVYTENHVNAAGNNTLVFSVGQHVNVNWNLQVRCIYEQQVLLPVTLNYSTTTLSNYSSRVEETRLFSIITGDASNCSTSQLHGHLRPGGDFWLAPDPEEMKHYLFLEYIMEGTLNCSVYQKVVTHNDGSMGIYTWTTSTEGNVPQTFVNVTKYSDNSQRVFTTAFTGYHEINGTQLNGACTEIFACGTSFCAANPLASSSNIQGAMGWACNGQVDCTNVSVGGPNYYPNSLIAHATWVFNQYFIANVEDGVSSCDFSGAAELTICGPNCTVCQVKPTATPAQIGAGLAWACGPDGVQDCSPIKPGGSNFYPNTTVAHANWAFNFYYQAYMCVPGWDACDFGGAAEVVPCDGA